jgi:hypothetical protein
MSFRRTSRGCVGGGEEKTFQTLHGVKVFSSRNAQSLPARRNDMIFIKKIF